MADPKEDQNINKESQEEPAKSPDPKKEGEEGGEPEKSWQELAGVDPKEFDTPEKLAKSYKDARKGLSDQGQKIKEAEEYEQRTTPLLKVIYGNPDLYKKVVEEVKKTYASPEDKDSGKETKEVRDPRIDEVTAIEEGRVISDFEKSVGLNRKSPESQAEIKKEIGAIMKRWIPANSRPSLQQLSVFLEDAWQIYKTKNNIEDEPEEKPNLTLGFGTPRAAQATIDKMDVSTLSAEERKAAERMGISPSDYLEEKKSIMKE